MNRAERAARLLGEYRRFMTLADRYSDKLTREKDPAKALVWACRELRFYTLAMKAQQDATNALLE